MLVGRYAHAEEGQMEPDKNLTWNQAELERHKKAVVSQFPGFGRQLLDFLERDQSRVVYAKGNSGYGSESFWSRDEAALRVIPCPSITKQFDISLEIPTLITNFPNLEPRFLRKLETSVELRRSASADKDIAIVVTSDSQASNFVRDRNRFAFPILVIDANRLQAGGYSDTDLRTELASLLRSVDHFDYSNEITTKEDFFGRLDETEALCRLASAGQSVGIFGLRRAGKTSLLFRVRTELRERGIDSVYVQLNAVPDADSFRAEILVELERLAEEKGHRRPIRDMKVPLSMREWLYGIDEVLNLIDNQVVILIDEIDLVNEDAAEYEESVIEDRRNLNRVMQQLRGIIQIRNDRSGRPLSFLVAGVAMSIFTQAVRFGRENQLFGFASARALKPMARDEMRQMVRTLGKRSGLKFNDFRLFDMLFSEYGGHPHLTRRACSVVADAVRTGAKEVVPYSVTVEDLESAFAAGGERSPAFLATQTLRAFARWYPDEARAIDDLLSGSMQNVDPELVRHAIDFGLCSERGTISLGALNRRR